MWWFAFCVTSDVKIRWGISFYYSVVFFALSLFTLSSTAGAKAGDLLAEMTFQGSLPV